MELARSASTANDSTFSIANWVGTLGGAALSVDNDPNTTPPPANRIFRCSAKRNATAHMAGGSSPFGMFFKVVIADGTSLQARAWLFDSTQNKWLPHGTTLTLTFATGNVGNVGAQINNVNGAKAFIQILANTGCTVMGFDVC